MGGYASILFCSLCDNVNNVISFVPQTILNNPIDLKYSNFKNIINKNTNILYMVIQVFKINITIIIFYIVKI